MLTLLFAAAVSAHAPAEKAPKPLPIVTKAFKVDGELKDLTPSFDPKMPPSAKGDSAAIHYKAAFQKDSLLLGVSFTDDVLTAEDFADVSLYFPESGTTSRGFVYRFGQDGVRASPEDAGPPAWAAKMVTAASKPDAKGKGWALEISIPAQAFPRFQGTKPLALEICVDYSDSDKAGQSSKLTTCTKGMMVGGPTRLPDELRKNLKLTAPADVEGVEAHETGWLGFSKLHYPTWALSLKGDTFTTDSLVELIAPGQSIAASSVALPLPEKLTLPDNRPVLTILTGKNPYLKNECIAGNELRLALYVIEGNVARRALEWPVSTCLLGRAMRFELTAEGGLIIGYTNGSTVQFTFAVDHFERTELGAR